MSGVSMIKISCGFCDGLSRTYPPLFPVIAAVASAIAFSYAAVKSDFAETS